MGPWPLARGTAAASPGDPRTPTAAEKTPPGLSEVGWGWWGGPLGSQITLFAPPVRCEKLEGPVFVPLLQMEAPTPQGETQSPSHRAIK